MANPTTNFGWQMPTSSDLVTDLPSDFEVFGQAVDTALVDLKGGTTGQVLSKNSNTDMDFVWVTSDDANAIQNTIVDAKGDLIAASAADTPARLAVGNNGETLVADSSTSTGLRYQGSMAAGRNFAINGGFDIWQRSTSATLVTVGSYIGPDRMACTSDSGGNGTASQITSSLPTGFRYGLKLQRTAGNTSVGIISVAQFLETSNSIPLAGQTVTVSFWAKAGANFSAGSSALLVRGFTGTGTDQAGGFGTWTGYAEPISSNPIITTSWVRYSVTGTLASTATQFGLRIGYTPAGTAGADDSLQITGIQVEIGSVATAFSRAGGTIQGELAACQRYFQRFASTDTGANPGTFGFFMVNTFSTTDGYGVIHLPVTLRTVPTLTTTGTASNYRVYQGSGGFFTLTALVLQKGGQNQCLIAFSSTGMAANGGGWVAPDAANNGFLSFSAEL